jgi:hypothetical protein
MKMNFHRTQSQNFLKCSALFLSGLSALVAAPENAWGGISVVGNSFTIMPKASPLISIEGYQLNQAFGENFSESILTSWNAVDSHAKEAVQVKYSAAEIQSSNLTESQALIAAANFLYPTAKIKRTMFGTSKETTESCMQVLKLTIDGEKTKWLFSWSEFGFGVLESANTDSSTSLIETDNSVETFLTQVKVDAEKCVWALPTN